MRTIAAALRQWAAGARLGLGRRRGVFLGMTLLVAAGSVLVPLAVLSVARKPVDYFTVNPWLKRLPEYLAASEVSWRTKLEKLPALALFWFSADSPMGGTEWGFAVDVADVVRIGLTSALVGLYFALWAERRARAAAASGGVVGAALGASGLSTGPCSVMGCGAPMLPVGGLAFTGLSSGALAFLALLATVATAGVLAALGLGIAYLGWSLGGITAAPSTPPSPGAASPR